jgi:protein dithiol oxidoreductase (disulfide-forming)
MNPVRRTLVTVIGLAPFTALAQRQDQPAFFELNPSQPVEAKDKIEVLEFFWYGCIHCYNLEAKLDTWLKTLPKDVEFRRVPAVFNRRWGVDASIFYGLEALGLLDKLHRPLFEAIHRDRLRTDNWPDFSAWLQKQGVDPGKFEATVKSFGVQTKTQRATYLTTVYKIDGTPAMAVHGRYTVPSSDAMLNTVNQLVATVRKTSK